jgi:hypothetical protein
MAMGRFSDNSPGFKAVAGAKVVMRFPDGTLTWTDGELTGDPPYMAMLFERAQVAPFGSPRPDGPSFDLSTWREDPWAFITRAEAVFLDESPTITAIPALPALPGPPASHAPLEDQAAG